MSLPSQHLTASLPPRSVLASLGYAPRPRALKPPLRSDDDPLAGPECLRPHLCKCDAKELLRCCLVFGEQVDVEHGPIVPLDSVPVLHVLAHRCEEGCTGGVIELGELDLDHIKAAMVEQRRNPPADGVEGAHLMHATREYFHLPRSRNLSSPVEADAVDNAHIHPQLLQPHATADALKDAHDLPLRQLPRDSMPQDTDIRHSCTLGQLPAGDDSADLAALNADVFCHGEGVMGQVLHCGGHMAGRRPLIRRVPAVGVLHVDVHGRLEDQE
mmetsp:Transcript_45392/g.112745  ORF Transcript_45392/g.112745 Transcript_45392/m.112745 type:complete len:271 (-) Transcript_45392:371-1183(-)